jgi:glucose/arabinose dehydrogenase
VTERGAAYATAEGAAVRIRRKLGAALALLSLGLVLAACVPPKSPPPPPPPPGPELPPPPPDQSPPPGSPTITRTDFVTGLDHPWDMSFLSDGTMFFTERSGPVKARLGNGSINNIVTPADVAPAGEAGMMGVAVDPNFASNRFLYTCYTAGSDNRVVRWQVNNTLNGVVGGGTGLVQGMAKNNVHNGCRVRFGPDGKLWITMGDATIGTAPQDLNSLNGKVPRANADGSPPSDNPFVGQPGDDRVYTFGLGTRKGSPSDPATTRRTHWSTAPRATTRRTGLSPEATAGGIPFPSTTRTSR